MITQRELLELIDTNPHKFKVYFLETGNVNGDNYIFVDKSLDNNIYGGGKRLVVINTVFISVYSKDNHKLQETVTFLREIFNGQVTYTREGEYYKCVLSTKLMVKEWQ